MSSLNKLAIRGIRSFDDKQISVIEFFSPVTVIVGHNGSGKTTIIECLKYATTGDQPPNARGGAFVHDPKMANEKEVKAQVKLRFYAANGTRMIAVRNLSVTVKKTGLTMKTLESILGLADGDDKIGKRAVISTKCAEMDTEIPQLLGVSKAVLENVIFCHQEESYWPLSEPSVLKKKFDEIFEATRYTKALDSIKSLRKERVSELNAEKERLAGLSREKAHADKLKNRITELRSTIAAKEMEYEQTKNQYEVLAEGNRKFYDSASNFREIFMKVESLEEKEARLRSDRDEAKLNLQEIEGTDDELEMRLKHFDDHINSQKQKKRLEDTNKQDLEDEIVSARKHHMGLLALQGGLSAEAEAQNRRIMEREQMIHEISEKYDIKGFKHSPLEREKVIEFLSKLGDTQRKQRVEFEKLQADLKAKTEDYNRKSRQLDSEMEGYKLQKRNLRDHITERQSSILDAERRLEDQQSLQSDLRALQTDIQEKKTRIEKIKSNVTSSKYDARLLERTEKSRVLEEKREQLNAEMRTLTLHADAGIKLDLKRGEIKSKAAEIQNTLDLANVKYEKLTGNTLTAENMERNIDRLLVTKEQEQADLETHVATANADLQKVETTLTSLSTQLRTKQNEVKALERKLKAEVDQDSLEEAIQEAMTEINHRKKVVGAVKGGSEVYEELLRIGKEDRICNVCNRHLEDNELREFERQLRGIIKQASSKDPLANEGELVEWETELDRLQKLRPVQVLRDQTKLRDIPSLEEQIKKQEECLPQLSKEAEEVQECLDTVKKHSRDTQTLKQHASTISRLQREIDRARQEVTTLEGDLASAGSTKTPDDVHAELNEVSSELRANERERQTLMQERERQSAALRNQENALHHMELNELDMTNKLRERAKLEEHITVQKKDIHTSTSKLRDIETKMAEAQAPIDTLEEAFRRVERELNTRLSQAQNLSQELNMVVDKLNNVNKGVERYVKDRRARELESCNERVEQADAQILELSDKIENMRSIISRIEKEINESGASIANLRENIRVRKLTREIKATRDEIASYDVDEAAKAKRNFETKYHIAKERENQLQASYSHIAGELSSHKAQLESWESDYKEFKDVSRKYTDQLIKVKMSDMANSDLEKYAKALDNAIMKYHTLKMEEVNDTMKHLWNKTYQGTDIDGIKIRSDIEGGASKRSYNYRVVMVKDQVEMDMRGRCSAGQKMLASIIIRLALSDSFSQNCGILALDEPTNALDIENIDALAASLVDIINERKSHSNFQLVIITHDENFLRKLGQADVMEYYWRVSRDSRQKSVIERQRFR
ncbi:hypothetical protein AX17_006250 [Amanita inopinata Kibby_2008]|nr:hypothetical protein AX17_006250 [Amanita inopinata Kibby_2008]